jgi:hypothetical protein
MKDEGAGLVPGRARSPARRASVAGRPAVVVRQLGLVPYDAAYDDMRRFTAARTAATADELWLLEHPPVYTLGQAAKDEHLLRETTIPVRRVDRTVRLAWRRRCHQQPGTGRAEQQPKKTAALGLRGRALGRASLLRHSIHYLGFITIAGA